MAYDYFTQPQGPAVNVSLFQEAAESGIRQGKASPSAFTSAVQGIKEGVEFGQQVQANAQNAEIRQHTIDQFPQRDAAQAVQDERQKLALQTEQLQAEAQQKNKDSILLASNLKAKAEVVKAQEQLDDLANTKAISDIIGSNDKAAITAALQDPKIKGTLVRNAELASKLLGTARVSLGEEDPTYRSAAASYSAIEQEKALQKQIAYDAQLKLKIKADHEKAYGDALGMVETMPEVASLIKQGNFDPRKLEVLPMAEYEQKAQGMGAKLTRRLKPNPQMAGSFLAYDGVAIKDLYSGSDARIDKAVYDYKLGKGLNGSYDTIDAAAAAAKANIPAQTELPANAAQVNGFNTPTPTPTPGAGVNSNILDAAAKHNEERFAAANAKGVGNTYTSLQQQGRQMVKQNAPAVNPIATPQTTPVPKGTLPVTAPSPTPNVTPIAPKEPVTVQGAQAHLSSLMGGADIQFNIDVPESHVNGADIQRVKDIPEARNESALMNGIITTESRGKTDAFSPKGAAGLMQLMKGAASDMGLKPEERFIVSKNIEAGKNYYTRLQTQISKAYSRQGLSITPDPRVVLAAYNGGPSYVFNAISKGYTTWDEIKEYMREVKAPDKAKENIEYPDRVILNSIPYLKGGNASDDAYIKSLLNFGIIDVA